MKKVLMVASSGGHMEELTRLSGVISQYDCCWITEKNDFQEQREFTPADSSFVPPASEPHRVKRAPSPSAPRRAQTVQHGSRATSADGGARRGVAD